MEGPVQPSGFALRATSSVPSAARSNSLPAWPTRTDVTRPSCAMKRPSYSISPGAHALSVPAIGATVSFSPSNE